MSIATQQSDPDLLLVRRALTHLQERITALLNDHSGRVIDRAERGVIHGALSHYRAHGPAEEISAGDLERISTLLVRCSSV